jgi:arylformamidase
MSTGWVNKLLKYLDLTMPLNQNTPVFPGDRKPQFKQVASIKKEGWNLHEFSLTTHTGTHLDVPWHMLEEGKKTQDFPLDVLIGRAILFDVRGQSEIDINLDGLQANDILVLRTDYSNHTSEADCFKRNPVISLQLAQKIMRRQLRMVGIDSFTIDNHPYDSHKLLFKQDILILENLVNLEKLGTEVFTLMVFPLKLDKMDGAPCRAVAEIG